MRTKLLALAAAMLVSVVGGPLQAANLLVNGGFENVSINHSTVFGNGSDGKPVLQGWQTEGYNFVFTENPNYELFGYQGSNTTADDFAEAPYASAAGASGSRFLLWGPDSFSPASNNGLESSPLGGNFVGADGAYLNAPLFQTVENLEIGREYAVSFVWAAAQQWGFSGETSDKWVVCFGTCTYTTNYDANGDGYSAFTSGEIQETAARTVPNHGFVPWQGEYFTFTATASTQTLSLLAYGTPLGQPPFALIDGVELNAVPEPTTWAMMLIGFGLVGGVMRTRRPSRNGRRALSAQII